MADQEKTVAEADPPQAYLAVTVIAECKTPDGDYVLVRLACWPDQPAIMVRADALVGVERGIYRTI